MPAAEHDNTMAQVLHLSWRPPASFFKPRRSSSRETRLCLCMCGAGVGPVGGEAQRGSLQQASVGGRRWPKSARPWSFIKADLGRFESPEECASCQRHQRQRPTHEATGPGALLNTGAKTTDHQHQAGQRRHAGLLGAKEARSGRGGSISRAASRSFDKTKLFIQWWPSRTSN